MNPSEPLPTSSSPAQQALDALAFAHGAIGDAIGLDEGLDGVAGHTVLAMIDAALRANGRLPTEVPPEDHAVAPTPYWTASIEPASSPAPDFTRLFLTTLKSFDWLEAPEVILEEDGDIGFDWNVGKACISAHLSANGRGGFAALVGEYRATGTFQLPEWPDELTHALKLLMAIPASSSAWEPQWQDISSAPKDCTPFLWHSEGVSAVIRWPEYEACFTLGHWMPLPPPPKEHP